MTASFTNVRDPAVAGLFYDRDPSNLAKTIKNLLQQAKTTTVPGAIRGIICPHAGYRYSGPIAASAYKLLEGKTFDTVIVLAPSHTASFEGASIAGNDAFETPLGTIPVSPKAAELARHKPFIPERPTKVQTPPWWRESLKRLPSDGQATPHTWEHSLEVQLPFLQETIGQFELIPIIMGRVEAPEVAKALLPLLNDKTLIVCSTDLSHYHSYAQAQSMDRSITDAISRLDLSATQDQEACGKGPILVLMKLAKLLDWEPKLLDLRNSGDTSGQRGQVVGYASYVFYDPKGNGPSGNTEIGQENENPEGVHKSAKSTETQSESPDEKPTGYTEQQGDYLVKLARHAIESFLTTGVAPKLDLSTIPEKLKQKQGCFVTLTERGQLRGCIGSILPQEPLCNAVISRAIAAATEDPRFPPVTASELNDLHIEVSILTVPEPLEYKDAEDLLKKLKPGVSGVVLKDGLHQATFLPQVWKQLPEPAEFLSHLSQKSGLTPNIWRKEHLSIETYQVVAFEE